MGWEKREGRVRYYYRKRRVKSSRRVVSEYVGNGLQAQEAALRDRAEREIRQQGAAARRQRRASAALVDREVEEACDLIRALMRADLLLNGYHTHRGQWRRREYT